MSGTTIHRGYPFIQNTDAAALIDDLTASLADSIDTDIYEVEEHARNRGNIYTPTNKGIAFAKLGNGLTYLPASGANRWMRQGTNKLLLYEPPVTWIDQGGVARLDEYGSYRVTACVTFAAGGTASTRTIELRMNTSTPLGGSRVAISEDNTNQLINLKIDTGPMLFNAATTLNIFLYQNSGSNITLTMPPWMMIERTHNSLA